MQVYDKVIEKTRELLKPFSGKRVEQKSCKIMEFTERE